MLGTSTVIQRVDIFGYDLSYAHGDYVMSSGRSVRTLPSTVVRVTTKGGLQGFGEACPLGSAYLPAFSDGARAALREVAPALIGVDATNLVHVNSRMDHALRGHGYAKSALDIACWDIFGRVTGQSIATLLGGTIEGADLPLYVAVPMGPPDEMARFVHREREGGIHRFQLKVGDVATIDVARVAAVVDATSSDDAVIADANGGWRQSDAIIVARQLDKFERVRIEQPCPTLPECLNVRRVTSLPMVLDEIITDLPALLWAAHENAMDHINLKIGRVGGLSKARAMRDVAVELGLSLTIEDSWGGDLVTAAVAHLASAVPSENLFAVSFFNDWTVEHVAGYQPRSSGGRGEAPGGPGLGVDVDVAALGRPLLSIES